MPTHSNYLPKLSAPSVEKNGNLVTGNHCHATARSMYAKMDFASKYDADYAVVKHDIKNKTHASTRHCMKFWKDLAKTSTDPQTSAYAKAAYKKDKELYNDTKSSCVIS